MANAILVMTDGTTRIDMLKVLSGFSVSDWRQAIAQYKGGGTWQGSALSDGRKLADTKFDNVSETFPIQAVKGSKQDVAIHILQEFFRLSEKAAAYGATRWQEDPVWLESRAEYETNTRYALVHTSVISELDDFYGTSFKDDAVMAGLSWIVERDHWSENQPGTGTAVEASAFEAYDGRNLGNVDSSGAREATTADEVYVANKRNMANLTDIYIDDGGVPSANLMDAALPFDLLPAVPAVNDAIYFGIDTTLANSGPFCSLVFDLSIAQSDCTIAWEYWDGGAFVALSVQDNTDAGGAMTGDAFDTTGVGSVHWEQPTDWTTLSVNGIAGYWIRARVTGIGAAPSPPRQQNRDIYSIVWPYIEIQSDQVGGDIAALIAQYVHNQSGNHFNYPAAPTVKLQFARAIVGLRSTARGSNFTAYINLADEQNPAGITITVGSASTTFVTDVRSPTGRAMRYNSAGGASMDEQIRIRLSSSISPQFYGEFHCYVRCRPVTRTYGDLAIQLSWIPLTATAEDTPIALTEKVLLNVEAPWQVIDLGEISIPQGKMLTETTEYGLTIDIENSDPADVYFYDLIIMPTDEWAADFYDWKKGGYISSAAQDQRLYIDSLTPKWQIRALVEQISTGAINFSYGATRNGPAIAQANSQQRYWYLFLRVASFVDGQERGNCEIASSLQILRNQRYLGARGGR